jgi:hypothetical protein
MENFWEAGFFKPVFFIAGHLAVEKPKEEAS